MLWWTRTTSPKSGRVALLWIRHSGPAAKTVRMPDDPDSYAAACMRTLHALNVDGGVMRWTPPDEPRWARFWIVLTRGGTR